MNNNTSLKIVIAETSVIIRSGLTAVLKRIPNLNAHPIEVSSPESLQNYIHMHPADIIIINPTFGGWFDLPAFKAEHGKSGIKYIAMVCSVIDNNILKEYDENFAMCDDIDVITSKINHLLHTEEEEEKDSEQETLSQREKEIITCVVKGMTNKAIADKLYLSIHTVITHRRNIARKLQIHSPAGLTIYAIVNKLVELGDIKDSVARAVGKENKSEFGVPSVVEMRPPALCEGCGHRDMYITLTEVLKEEYPSHKVFSDIGCYTLGANAPFNAINSCVDMGASITMAKGAADGGLHPSVAVIGDSTFTHSGMTGLLDCVNENANVVIVISDNETTAMTGGQDSAGTGRVEASCIGLGVDPAHIRVVVPLKKNHEEMRQIIREEIEYNGVSVIIPRRECIQTLARKKRSK